jgi:hypothetical protein
MPAATDPESRWFTIYVHTCDADPRGSGERPTEGKQYVGQVIHDITHVNRGYADVAERAMRRRWGHECREESVLGRAVRQFGAERFTHKIVDIVLGQTSANRVEEEWADKLDCYEPRGYNRRRAGLQGYVVTYEERSEFCKLGWAKIPIERRREIIRNGQNTLGPEGLSKRAFRRAKSMGSEKLSAAISKGHVARGPEGQAAAAAKRIQNMDFCAASQKAMITLGAEGMSRRANKIWNARWNKALKLAEECGDLEKAEKIRASIDAAARIRQFSAEDLRRLQESLATGVSLRELATQLGLPYMSLYRLFGPGRTT